MSRYENEGRRGLFRTIDGALLAGGGQVLATIGEDEQTRAQSTIEAGSSVGSLAETIASLPDARAVGVAMGAVGMLALIDGGRLSATPNMVGSAKVTALNEEAAVQTRSARIGRRVIEYAGAAVAAATAYKIGETLSFDASIYTIAGEMAVGLAGGKAADIYTKRRLLPPRFLPR